MSKGLISRALRLIAAPVIAGIAFAATATPSYAITPFNGFTAQCTTVSNLMSFRRRRARRPSRLTIGWK